MKYAEVVVNLSLGRRPSARGRETPVEPPGPGTRGSTFFYHIPPALTDRVRPGCLVYVSFGTRHVQGVVLGLADRSPVEKTKPIEALLHPEPLLTPALIELARWMSDYYLAPLIDCVRLMLPPGISQPSVALIELGPPDAFPPHPTPEERAVLERVRRAGAVPAQRLMRAAGRAVVERLLRQGALVQQYRLLPPRARPKTQRVARLTIQPDASAFERLARAPKQRAILELLAERGPLPVEEVHKAVGSPSALRALVQRGWVELLEREVWRDPLAGREFVPTEPPVLTADQEEAWQTIRAGLAPLPPAARVPPRVFLLHGVTGSGKTEIYLRAIAEILSQGRQAIVLVPEIALTPQTVRRFAARFGERVTVLHSGLSLGERYDGWRRAQTGDVHVVIGPRSAVFAPLPRLGLIVIDEEHEWTYKQDHTPRYHARDVAQRRAAIEGATLILGSATPAVESYFRAQRGQYVLVKMPRRIMGHRKRIEEQKATYRIVDARTVMRPTDVEEALYADLPPVQVVDMRQELRAGNRRIFSRALQQALRETLAAGEQAILFLNRRGAASFVMCRDCGYVLRCPRCTISLTYHTAEAGLICHHCGHREMLPQLCPACASPYLRRFGIGTQRVQAEVQELFPEARVVRWDRDTTRRRGAHEEILGRFVRGEADVMVGTQMVAKGLDLPLVTLVGVVTADTALNLPDFRAGERTFQLLTQVAGRAGRSILGGRVIIQTYTPNHYAIQAASRHSYTSFYTYELAFRREHGYPPFRQLARLVYSHSSPAKAEGEAKRIAAVLRNKIARLGLPETTLIGPAPAFFQRVRGQTRWHLIVRAPDVHALLEGLQLPAGWSIDVDPVNVL